MVNRVLLDGTGLKISREGVNVLAAANVFDYVFNSDYLAANRFMAGSVAMGSSHTVNYGVTVSPLPFFAAQILLDGRWNYWARNRMQDSQVGTNAKVYNNRVVLTQTLSDGTVTVRYSLWET